MIQIRNNIFETNSSSADVLIIPKDQGVHVPKRFIYVDDETSLKPSEKVIYSIIRISGFLESAEQQGLRGASKPGTHIHSCLPG